MQEITRVGVDLAKRVIQVLAVNVAGLRGYGSQGAHYSARSFCFVAIKSIEQQSMLCIHRLREGFKTERTACINRIRGLLDEFGLVFAKKSAVLRQALPDAIADAINELGGLARLALQRAWAQWQALDDHLAWCDERIAADLKASRCAKLSSSWAWVR